MASPVTISFFYENRKREIHLASSEKNLEEVLLSDLFVESAILEGVIIPRYSKECWLDILKFTYPDMVKVRYLDESKLVIAKISPRLPSIIDRFLGDDL